MFSGIASQAILTEHQIPIVVSALEVGRNLIDHSALYQLWKLKHPEQGLALGTSKWIDAAYEKGLPWDWVVNEAVPVEKPKAALEMDQTHGKTHIVPFHRQSLLDPSRSHLETLTIYSNVGAPVPVDGSLIATSVMLLLPTSRGSISIASATVSDAPVITPNYYDTETDRIALVYACIEGEAAPPGMPSLSDRSTDAEIDERIRSTGMAHYHSAGTAAMGKVVDSKLRVYGVLGLRIADASVLPVPIGGHPQATLYALAEQAADIILQD
ncbi:MAG: hypothetical protein M1822_009079 [Bathelium mastoideum]|nr:MAG: hypothetical protein M1822_009079 [Bathelium mastoideum]